MGRNRSNYYHSPDLTDKFEPESDCERGYRIFFILSEQVSFAGFAGVGARWCPEEKCGGEHTEEKKGKERKREEEKKTHGEERELSRARVLEF